jgi:hypothetical protein
MKTSGVRPVCRVEGQGDLPGSPVGDPSSVEEPGMAHRGLDPRLVGVFQGSAADAPRRRQRPSTDSAYFAPATPGSMKIASCSGISRSWYSSALA